MKRTFALFFAVSSTLALAGSTFAYVDVSPTLGFIIKDSTSIVVLQVDKVSVEKRGIIFKKIADLKAPHNGDVVRHHLDHGSHPREPKIVLDWAQPGKTALAFINDKTAVICTGEYWYECVYRADSWWIMTSGRPELSLAYFGTAEKLRDAVTAILGGKEVVITAVNHGAKFGVFQYENVAFHKALRGKDCPLFRIKASLEMPETVWRVSAKDSPWIVGVGAFGSEDIPLLVEGLKSSDAKTRAKAADDLGLMGWRARSTSQTLMKLCDDTDPFVRISAARAIDLVGADFTYPVTVLGEILRKSDRADIRAAAATALGDLEADGKGAVIPLQEALRDADANVRWTAAEALGRIGPDAAAAVPALAMALRDPAVRVMAADALAGIGKAARGAVPLLIDGVNNGDPDFRWTAAVALTQIDAKSARVALPMFIEKLKDPDHRVRWDAMAYIVPMGSEAKDAAPAVRAMVKRGNGVASACLAAIAGPDAIDALPVLLHVLADDWDTTTAIAQIGPAVLPELMKLIDNPDVKNHHLAIKALGLLANQSEKAIPALIDCLHNHDPIARCAAAATLGNVEPRSKEIASGLRIALKDREPAVRLAASRALRLFDGAEAGFAVSALMELLASSDPETRRDAAAALGEFGSVAKAALPPLHKLLSDSDPLVRNAASWAGARITSSAANRYAVITLISALRDRDPRTRLDAARHLGSLGPDAREAIAALREARQDDVETVRNAAAEALAKVQAK
ncbi:MAG: HEAT repeat domain-containing protein [Planctomycetota bacterium]